jgi:tape measure domain-containing protein
MSLKGAVVGLTGAGGIGLLAKSFVDTASKMDQMRISLDTITKGHGDEWFETLNKWAMQMPVNTEEAIKSFQRLVAMGLKPTERQMTILVDAVSGLGGGKDVMSGLVRALGQIQTKGKVAGQELRQLAEWGIPAYEILQQKLGLTADQVVEIGRHGVSSTEALKALWEGMEERYGGLSQKIMNRWAGLTERLRSLWVEFQRQVMSSGVMAEMERQLKGVVEQLEASFGTGEFARKAHDFAMSALEFARALTYVVEGLHNAFHAFRAFHFWGEKLWAGLKADVEEFNATLKKVPTKLPGWMGGGERAQGVYDEAQRAALLARQKEQALEIKMQDSLIAMSQMTAMMDKARARIDKSLDAPYKPPKPTPVAPGWKTAPSEINVSNIFLSGEKAKTGAAARESKRQAQDAKRNLDDMRNYVQRRMDDRLSIEEDVNRKIKKMTLSEYEYKKFLIDKEVQDMRQRAVGEKEIQDKITKYRIMAYEQLDDRHEEHNEKMIELSRRTAEAMEQAFSDFFFDAMQMKFKSLHDYIIGISNSLQRISADLAGQMVKDWAFGPTKGGGGGGGGFGGFFGSIGNWFKGLFDKAGAAGAGGAFISTGPGLPASMTGAGSLPYVGGLPVGAFSGGAMAKGGVFQNGKIVPYQFGGIFGSVANVPTLFGMAGKMGSKTLGLMGEAGPEAVMPLMRIGGKLGVRAATLPGQTFSVVNNFAVNAVDAGSFALPETMNQIMSQFTFAMRGAQRNL